MSDLEAGQQLWAALHAHVRTQDAVYWRPTRWERLLPEWLRQEREVVAAQGTAGQSEQERTPGGSAQTR